MYSRNEIFENLRKQFGYCYKCLVDEFKKLINRYRETFINNLKNFSEKLYPNLGDEFNIWSIIASIDNKKIEEIKKIK